jgi:hypothetical protein
MRHQLGAEPIAGMEGAFFRSKRVVHATTLIGGFLFSKGHQWLNARLFLSSRYAAR